VVVEETQAVLGGLEGATRHATLAQLEQVAPPTLRPAGIGTIGTGGSTNSGRGERPTSAEANSGSASSCSPQIAHKAARRSSPNPGTRPPPPSVPGPPTARAATTSAARAFDSFFTICIPKRTASKRPSARSNVQSKRLWLTQTGLISTPCARVSRIRIFLLRSREFYREPGNIICKRLISAIWNDCQSGHATSTADTKDKPVRGTRVGRCAARRDDPLANRDPGK